MLCTVIDLRKKFYYFIKKEFPDNKIDRTKALYYF